MCFGDPALAVLGRKEGLLQSLAALHVAFANIKKAREQHVNAAPGLLSRRGS